MFQLSMYYLSFLPLWISVLFIDILNLIRKTVTPYTEIISIGLIILAFTVSLIVMERKIKSGNLNDAQVYTLESVKEEKFATAEFLMSYIFPLFAFDFTTWDGTVLFLIFFVFFGYLCMKHNYFCTSIVLDLKEYRIYECVLKNKDDKVIEKRVISREPLADKTSRDVVAKALNNDYFLSVKHGNGNDG